MQIRIIEMKQDGIQVEFLLGENMKFPYRTTHVLPMPFNILLDDFIKLIKDKASEIKKDEFSKGAVQETIDEEAKIDAVSAAQKSDLIARLEYEKKVVDAYKEKVDQAIANLSAVEVSVIS